MPSISLIPTAVLVGLAAPAVALAGVPAGVLSVQVDPRGGDDARCALVQGPDPRGALGCRTVARAAALANGAVQARLVNAYLAPGRHDVDVPVRFTRGVQFGGPGGVQAVVNMTGQGSLSFAGGVVGGLFGLTGTAAGTWITTAGPGSGLFQITATRARADAPTIRMTGATSTILSSVVVAQGHGVAVEMRGGGYLQDTTVSGGRLALGTPGGNPDLQAPSVNASVLAGGLVSWGGAPGIYNSAVSVPQSSNAPAIEVRDESPAAPARGDNYPRVVLSSVWQRGCAPAIGLWRPARAGGLAQVLLAGSLVRVPAPACATIITGGLGAGPGRTGASIANNWFAPTPGPLLVSTQGLDALVAGAGAVGDPRVEGGLAGADWPGGMMPAAGSPLINAATDPFSLNVAEIIPQSLSVRRYGAAGARPRGAGSLRNPAPDIGAYERPDLLGAVPAPPPPGPDGIGIQPDGPGGGLAPVVNDMPGAIPAAGAPTAGVDTGQRTSLPGTRTVARVAVRVGPTAAVTGPLRVRVRAFQASRVVVVLRRDFRDDDRVRRSRVIGRAVARFAKAGTRWVTVPLNSGARRGLVGVAATARQPGLDPGFAQAATRLVGAEPVSISAPSALAAGANRVTVTTRRGGRVVVVARTAAGRVIGRSVFVAPGAGRRTVTLRLAPAGLVTGTISISARIAGADPVSIIRPAG
jgi:hypothetical protein